MKGCITLYSLKSNRSNAKSTHMTKQIFNKDGLKNEFTINDLYDFADFMSKAPYKNFNIVVYKSDTCICTINNFHPFSDIESGIAKLYEFMRILNFKDFEFTKKDIFNDTNFKFYIHNYYQNKKGE